MPNSLLVYIAGSYQADTGEQIAHNIEAACHRARLLHERFGELVYPVVPHLMGGWHGTALSPTDPMRDYHMVGLVEVMRRCDAVWLPGGWIPGYSMGVQFEFHEALDMRIPCYISLDELEAALPGLLGKPQRLPEGTVFADLETPEGVEMLKEMAKAMNEQDQPPQIHLSCQGQDHDSESWDMEGVGVLDTTASILANEELMESIEEGRASMQRGGEWLTKEEVFGRAKAQE